jgi:hypothetical protein
MAPTGAEQARLTVCYDNPGWVQPPLDARTAYLRADPRYPAHYLSTIAPERIHAELGPSRSNSSLGWFVAGSGLWTDPGWRSMTCSGDLRGRAELWGIAVRFQRFELRGPDLVAVVRPESRGVQIVQLQLPPAATALHFVDPAGAIVAPDVNLRPQPGPLDGRAEHRAGAIVAPDVNVRRS